MNKGLGLVWVAGIMATLVIVLALAMVKAHGQRIITLPQQEDPPELLLFDYGERLLRQRKLMQFKTFVVCKYTDDGTFYCHENIVVQPRPGGVLSEGWAAIPSE